jgi:V/A-type H+-transporting ATPase subunit E
MSDPIPRVPPKPADNSSPTKSPSSTGEHATSEQATDKHATGEHATASGVQALIDTLREQGVSAGQTEAERIIAAAKHDASALIENAQRDAARIRESAQRDLENERRAAHEALQLAARDTALELKSHLVNRFRSELGKLVHNTLSDPEVLRHMLLELAQDTRAHLEQDHRNKPTRILIHTDAKQTGDPLAELTRSVARDMLKDTVTIAAEPSRKHTGMRVQIDNEDVEIDLSDAAITNLLAQHLLPRFRNLLEGTL